MSFRFAYAGSDSGSTPKGKGTHLFHSADCRSWSVECSISVRNVSKTGKDSSDWGNRFGQNGFRLKIRRPGLTVKGKLDFGTPFPLWYDIMGPLAMVTFLECRHSVWSMRYAVNGTLCINNHIFDFQNAEGYWEGDEGCSFQNNMHGLNDSYILWMIGEMKKWYLFVTQNAQHARRQKNGWMATIWNTQNVILWRIIRLMMN